MNPCSQVRGNRILVAALAALFAAPVAAQTVVGNGASEPASGTICPGTASRDIDNFTVTSTPSDLVKGFTYALSPVGAFGNIAKLEVYGPTGLAGAIVPQGDSGQLWLTTPVTVTGASNWRLAVIPKTQAAMASAGAGTAPAVTARVTGVMSALTRTISDTTSATITIDNAPDADVKLTSVTSPAATQVVFAWSTAANVVILRSMAAPVATTLVDGTSYAVGGEVVYAPGTNQTGWTDTTVTSGKTYYYKIFTKDACASANYSPGVNVGPITAGGTTEGALSGNGPVVGILNPGPGPVTLPFRVQVRIYSPTGLAISNPLIVFDTGAATTQLPLTFNSFYGGSATGGVYEATVTGAPTVTAGNKYTLRAQATNTAGTVYSARVGVTVNNGVKGDGNLLVRDNSSQLCSDCHAYKTHSSEATGTKYGSWFAGCRTCHDPHGTTNASLVAEKVMPTAVNGQKSPTTVIFSTRSGYAAGGGVPNAAIASYVNGDAASNGGRATGVCQVCHTRTVNSGGSPMFRADGTGTSHDGRETSNCATCHKHSDGFKGTGCNGCHGQSAGRTPSVANTDPNYFDAYPPVVPPTATVFVANGGVHEGHLNKATYKRNPLVCADCHATLDAAHPNNTTTVQWGTLATMNGATMFPANGSVAGWVASPTCTNYCHGNTLPDGSPSTKDVADWRGTPAISCGSCHGVPPAAPHTTRTDCNSCHGAGYTLAGISGAALDTHMDGTTPPAGCTSCHGGDKVPSVSGTDADLSGAPPNLATPLPTGSVANGAHLKHADQATYRTNPLQCEDCHLFPQGTEHNNTKASVAWSALAKTGPTTPTPAEGDLTASYTTTPACTNYCHGATLSGTRSQLLWNAATWTVTCAQCHGAPPAAADGHPQNTTCDTCHGIFSNAGYNFGTKTLSAAAKVTHIDASTQVPNKGCVNCHGDVSVANGTVVGNTDFRVAPGANAAAIDTKGNTNVQRATAPGVGAHIKHVNAGMMSANACTVCHPTTTDNTHANGTVAMAWTSPATGLSVVPTHSQTSPYNCTNYCHSNAGPVNTSGANTVPAVKTVSWTSTTAMVCTDCHDTGGAATTLSHAHQLHTAAGTYAYTCEKCHADTAAGAGSLAAGGAAFHVNVNHNVKFNTVPLDQAAGTYAQSPTFTCSNTYCHSNGVDRTPPFTSGPSIAWHNGVVGCGSCHNAGTAMATQTHGPHVNNAATGNYGCYTCHSGVNTAGDTITTYSGHVNGATITEILGTMTYTDGTADGVANGSCATTYCHSSGRDPAASLPAYVSMAWGGTAIGCNGCHGVGNAYGMPNYADGATLATANSHATHVVDGSSCQDCHSGLVNATGTAIVGTSHTNTTRDVAILAAYDSNGVTSNYNTATKQCSGITCHGSSTPVWGDQTTATCASCHNRTTAQGGDLNNFLISDGTQSYINSDEWTGYGHGSTSTAGNSFSEFSAVAGNDRCVYCHDSQNPATAGHKLAGNPFRLRGAANASGVTALYSAASADTVAAVCWNCHDSSATVAYGVDPDGASALPKVGPATARVDSYHYGATDHTATADGGQRCWDCHDVHGDSTNLAMIGKETLRDAADLHGLPGTWSTTNAVLTSRAPGGYTAGSTLATATGICQVCHTTTSFWRADGTLQTHEDNDCMGCHAHNQAATRDGFAGSGECVTCHAGQKVGTYMTRRAIVTEFMSTWSHKRSAGGGVTNGDCVVCHMEGNPADAKKSTWHGDGYINLRDPDTGSNIKQVTFSGTPGTYTSGATDQIFTQFSRNLNSATLEAAVQAMQINQCLKCHDANGATSTLARVTGGTAGRPFGYTISPAANYPGGVGLTACATGTAGCVTNVNDSFATTNSSYHPVRGKNNNWYAKFTRMVAPWNSATRLTAATTTPLGGSYGNLISCWDCHALNGDSGTITKSVTAHGGAETVRGNPFTSGTPAAGTAVTLCNKCHKLYNFCGSTADACGSFYGHGPGSAFSSDTGRSTKTAYLRYGCNVCHSAGYTSTIPRPVRAQDAHGVNALNTTGVGPPGIAALSNRWTNDSKPYAFIRNRQLFGNHQPRNIGTSNYSPGCDMSNTTGAVPTACTGQGEKTYAPGGTY